MSGQEDVERVLKRDCCEKSHAAISYDIYLIQVVACSCLTGGQRPGRLLY